MRKTQVALAALALVASSAALAEGVTVSGRFDVGYQTGSGSRDLDGAGLKKGLKDSLLGPNQLNFSSSEDLGNGMKANFMLMTTFTPSTIGGGFVFLQQNVGLSGDFGAVRAGQTVDSFWGNGVANFDVTGGGNMGSAVTAVFMHGASGVFHDNTVQYVSPSLNGLNVAATYVTNPGSTARGSAVLDEGSYSVAATYDVSNVKLGAGSSRTQNAASSNNHSYFVGAGTDFGIAKVNALFLSSGNTAGFSSTATLAKAATWGLNSAIPLGNGLTAVAAYYSTSGDVINGKNTSVGLQYALSKRTTLFTNVERASGATLLGLGQNGGNTAAGSNDVTGGQGSAGSIVTVGIGHSF
jgi:predicted porin